MPSRTLTLDDGLTRLTLAPQVGGSIVNWQVIASGQPLLRPSDDDAVKAGLPGRLACYPLVPWSNRIGGGGFSSPHHWFALEPNNSPKEALPIHGSAWQQAWRVLEHTPRHAWLQLDSATPFAYRAQLRYSLNAGQLNIDLRVTHQDDKAAWHGLGLHPYLPRTAHTRLQARAAQVWQCDNAGLSTQRVPVPDEWDFNTCNTLPTTRLDHCFTGWDGHALISQPDLGYTLEWRAKGSPYCLVFCPPGQDFFCFEPVSHPVNAHHLPGRPGLHLLHKGHSARLSVSLQYRAEQAKA